MHQFPHLTANSVDFVDGKGNRKGQRTATVTLPGDAMPFDQFDDYAEWLLAVLEAQEIEISFNDVDNVIEIEIAIVRHKGDKRKRKEWKRSLMQFFGILPANNMTSTPVLASDDQIEPPAYGTRSPQEPQEIDPSWLEGPSVPDPWSNIRKPGDDKTDPLAELLAYLRQNGFELRSEATSSTVLRFGGHEVRF